MASTRATTSGWSNGRATICRSAEVLMAPDRPAAPVDPDTVALADDPEHPPRRRQRRRAREGGRQGVVVAPGEAPHHRVHVERGPENWQLGRYLEQFGPELDPHPA